MSTISARVTHGENRPLSAIHRKVSLEDGLVLANPAPGAVLKSYRAHEPIFRQGDRQVAVYEVVDGVVCTYRLLSDGRRQVSAFYFPGDLMGIAGNERHLHSAETIAESRIRSIPVSALDQALQTRPDLARRLLRYASNELADLSDHLLSLGRRTAMERIAAFLVSLSRRNAQRGEDPAVVVLPMTRADIADFLGLTIETVSRNLTILKHDGIIDLPQPQRVLVRDGAALQRLADSEPGEM